jgi:hypothetical protein
MNGQQIETYLSDVATHAFDFNLQEYLQDATRSVIGLQVNHETKVATPLFGNVPEALLALLNQQQFQVENAAAGYRVALREKFLAMQPPIAAANVAILQELPSDFDVFLIADDVQAEPDKRVKALIFHEVCHLYEDAHLASLNITEGAGEEAYDSLPSAVFRVFHTAPFFDIVVEAAPRLCAFDNVFTDDLDLIGHAFQYDYEGDPPRYQALLKDIAIHHLDQHNAPTLYTTGYLPHIDAVYRGQLKKNLFDVDPNHQVTYGDDYIRNCLTLTVAAYQKLAEDRANADS